MRQQILIIYHSNAGQTRRAVEVLCKGFASGSSDLRIFKAKISSEVEQPFPWPFLHFFSIFPDCVRGRAPKVSLEWEQGIPEGVDLIVFASPVWFLSPSLPAHGFFQSEAAKLLRGKPVVTLITSRNMWASALQQLRDYIASAGGRVVDSIVLMDLAPPWTTFITTPVWMLTGKKKLAGFPEAGIQTEDFERLEGFGKKLALQKEHWAEGQCFLAGDSSVALAEKYIFPEIVVKNLVFKPWAALIHLAEPLGLGFKNFLVGCFILALLGSILVLIPLILVSKMFLKIFVGNFLKKLKAQALYPYDS